MKYKHAFAYLCRTLCNVVSVMTLACDDCSENSWYLLLSNKLSTVVDLLAHHITVSSSLKCATSRRRNYLNVD